MRAPTQVEEAHAARISCKRLRYLIEPYKDDPAVDKLVQRLKALQDVLGELHDTHLAMAEAAELPEVRARLSIRQERLYAQLDRDALALELGDALWCLTIAAQSSGVSLEEVAQRNISKLRGRYPGGYSDVASRD